MVRVSKLPTILFAVAAVACSSSGETTDSAAGTVSGDSARGTGVPGTSADCTPLETREANAPDQRAASAGQTRTCGIRSDSQAFEVTVLATTLANPWSVEPLPGGDILVTEKPGRMRIVS